MKSNERRIKKKHKKKQGQNPIQSGDKKETRAAKSEGSKTKSNSNKTAVKGSTSRQDTRRQVRRDSKRSEVDKEMNWRQNI